MSATPGHRRSASDAVQSLSGTSNKFISDEESETDLDQPSHNGFLYKWTNYIHGWQPRYFLLQDGTLEYYKSEVDSAFGCRGAIKIGKALIQAHEFDECRFEICVNDCVWYLRAETTDERGLWMRKLEEYKMESGYASSSDLRRYGSVASIASHSNRSITSGTSSSSRNLREKLAELETFRDIVIRQVENLQTYFDETSTFAAPSPSLKSQMMAVDSNGIPAAANDNSLPQSLSAPTTQQQQQQLLANHFQTLSTGSIGDADEFQSVASETMSDDGGGAKQQTQPTFSIPAGSNSSGVGLLQTSTTQPADSPSAEKGKNNWMDFKGEALTFKATTSGILTTLSHCIEIMQQREENWRKKLDKEIERRKRAEDNYKMKSGELSKLEGDLGRGGTSTGISGNVGAGGSRPVPGTTTAGAGGRHGTIRSGRIYGGPDFEEGPNSALNEEEWHDAVDAALDKEDMEEERIKRIMTNRGHNADVDAARSFPSVTLTRDHVLFNEVERTTVEQLQYGLAGVEEGVWTLFAEDGEMKMYKREELLDGMVVDPLKATHSVRGVTAKEYCHYFYEAEYKLDWDLTLEDMTVVERISDDTLIIHQVHKKVWPTAQRESLFWSHMRRSNAGMDKDAFDCYVVANKDTERIDVPLGKNNLRVGLKVAMVCQTIIDGPIPEDLSTIRRDQLTCRIVYVAQVNPGGWAPASALRVVYRREYPKFLKRFTEYVLTKTSGKSSLSF